jgi:hypothetical protein
MGSRCRQLITSSKTYDAFTACIKEGRFSSQPHGLSRKITSCGKALISLRFPRLWLRQHARYHSNLSPQSSTAMTRILCVAEKPSIAKAVAGHLSGGRYQTVRPLLRAPPSPWICDPLTLA